MPHDWGVSVSPDLSTDEVIKIRDDLRAGCGVELPDCVRSHEKAAEWQEELRMQMLAAYEAETARRLS